MAVIVFLLGRLGSGKSQVARSIATEFSAISSSVKGYSWKVVHITDYKFLLAIQQEDPDAFELCKEGGFRVKEFHVLHEALIKVKAEIESEDIQKQKLILVEFARNTYEPEIWSAFDFPIMESAYFLYLKTDIKECMRRVRNRAANPQCGDDTFVPDDIMKGYYQEERPSDLYQIANEERVKIVDNNGEWHDTWNEIETYLQSIRPSKSPSSVCKELQPVPAEVAPA